MKLSALTDARLYQKCKLYGANARTAMRKFEALLPEVYRRRLYKKRGCASIHEFASKLAGMSHNKVDRILQLAKKLEDKPKLKEIFESGGAGYAKIERVAYIATSETDEMWANKAKIENQTALNLSVQEFRQNNRLESPFKRTFEPEKFTKIAFNISREDEKAFLALKQKFEKESGETLSYGEIFSKMLKGLRPAPERQKIIQICPECVSRKAKISAQKGEISRYVPQHVRDLVLAKQNYSCAHKECFQPPTELHHIGGFALHKTHDPYFLEYLCKKHHLEKHARDAHVQKYR